MPSKQAAAERDEAQVRGVSERIVSAWAKHDADAFAETFTEDGSLILPGGIYLTSREEIRAFMAQGFAGPYKGTQVTGSPIQVKPLAAGVVLMLTQGGVLAPGEKTVAPEREIRASWLIVKRDGQWLLTAYQNTPVRA
jgi:uncharacterized protein (TIGR02246 family)